LHIFLKIKGQDMPNSMKMMTAAIFNPIGSSVISYTIKADKTHVIETKILGIKLIVYLQDIDFLFILTRYCCTIPSNFLNQNREANGAGGASLSVTQERNLSAKGVDANASG
jgi:hypothetical protein